MHLSLMFLQQHRHIPFCLVSFPFRCGLAPLAQYILFIWEANKSRENQNIWMEKGRNECLNWNFYIFYSRCYHQIHFTFNLN